MVTVEQSVRSIFLAVCLLPKILTKFALSDSFYGKKHLYANTSYITDLVMAENIRGIIKGHRKLANIREAVREGWLREITPDSAW